MSEDEAKAFIERVQKDKELQEKLKSADSEEKFFAVAKEAGLDFTKEEWLSVAPKKAGGELSEQQLETASGGDGPMESEGWLDDMLARFSKVDP